MINYLIEGRVEDDYRQHYNSIDREIYDAIIKADPSTRNNSEGEPETVGFISTTFLLQRYLKGDRDWVSDLEKVTQAATTFLAKQRTTDLTKDEKNLKNYPSVKSFIDYMVDGIKPELEGVVEVDPITNVYNTAFTEISREEFDEIIKLDPQTSNKSVGPDARRFLLPRYLEGEKDFLTYKFEVTSALTKYNKVKKTYSKELQDIVNFKSVNEFVDLVLSTDGIETDLLKSLRNDERTDRNGEKVKDSIKLILSTSKYYILQPLNPMANHAIARHVRWSSNEPGMHWCTGTYDMMYNHFYTYGGRNGKNIYCIMSKQDDMDKNINFQFNTTNNNQYLGELRDGFDNLTNFEKVFNLDPDLCIAMMRYEEFKHIPEIRSYYEQIKLLQNGRLEVSDISEIDNIRKFKHLVKHVILNNPITEIPESCFMDFVNLEKVDFNDNITKIGAEAFKNCESLKTIRLPKNLVRIGPKAFSNCKNLNGAIEIPNSCDYIGFNAFEHTGNRLHLNILDNRPSKLRIPKEYIGWFTSKHTKVISDKDSIYNVDPLNEEILDEKLPSSLANAYKKSQRLNYSTRANLGSHTQLKNRRSVDWDYNTADYEKLSKEEAKTFLGLSGDSSRAKRLYNKDEFNNRLSQLRFVVADGVFEFESNVGPKDALQALLIPQNINSNTFSSHNYTSFKNGSYTEPKSYGDILIIIDIATDIYKTNEYDYPISNEIQRKRNRNAKVDSIAHLDTSLLGTEDPHNPRREYDQLSAGHKTYYYGELDTGLHNIKQRYNIHDKRSQDYADSLVKKKAIKNELVTARKALKTLETNFEKEYISEDEYNEEKINLIDLITKLTSDYKLVCEEVNKKAAKLLLSMSTDLDGNDSIYVNRKRRETALVRSIKSYINKLEQVHKQLKNVGDSIDKLEKTDILVDDPEFKQLKRDVSNIEETITKKQRHIQEIEDKINYWREQIEIANKEILKLSAQKDISEEEMAELVAHQSDIASYFDTLVEKLVIKKQEEISNLYDEYERLKKLLNPNYQAPWKKVQVNTDLNTDLENLIEVIDLFITEAESPVDVD